MTQSPQDWQTMAQDWQRQPSPVLDLEALRQEVERRGREIRRVVRWEIGSAVLVIAVCLFVAFAPDSAPAERALFAGMALALVIYQSLLVRLRRTDNSRDDRDALSLVDLEVRRAITVLRYWRWGMWTALGMWLALYAYFLAGVQLGWEGVRLPGLALGLAINIATFPLMGLYGLWRCRQARARLARFRSLREQLAP